MIFLLFDQMFGEIECSQIQANVKTYKQFSCTQCTNYYKLFLKRKTLEIIVLRGF